MAIRQRKFLFALCAMSIIVCNLNAGAAPAKVIEGRWSVERIQAWYEKLPWLVGCNYYPATAINQIEMWQKSTFDLKTIEKELDLAKATGFNTLRVYLHCAVWEDDEKGLYKRMDKFLEVCKKRGIRPWFVFFDDCHHASYKLGPQPEPVIKWHNSGWVRCPSYDIATRYRDGKCTPKELAMLKGYVQNTIRRFKDDKRVLMWELYNEPGNGFRGRTMMGNGSEKLAQDSWVWAREVNPSQPISSNSAGSVGRAQNVNNLNTDVHSVHCYNGGAAGLRKMIEQYGKDGRPVFVTEWLARPRGSRVQDSLPVMKDLKAAAINWGFVSGKSGTVWSWHSTRVTIDGEQMTAETMREKGKVLKPGEPYPEPRVWFHDLYRIDGTPFDQEEIDIFKKLTGVEGGGQKTEDGGQKAEDGGESGAYLMAYFRSRREKQGEQLYYAVSRDGLNWEALNKGKPVFAPDCRLRDPYLKRVNGRFHLVHTKGINHPHIFHWESTDLINWEGGEVHVMPGRHRSWAPEFIWCPKEKVFYVFWASDHDGHNTMYYQKTRDWKDIKPEKSKVYYDLGIHDIDLSIVEHKGIYYGFHKPGKVNDGLGNLLSTSTSLDPAKDSFAKDGKGKVVFEGEKKPIEGPEVFKLIGQEKWYVYADPFRTDLQVWETTDFKTYRKLDWKPVSGAKHGSVISITEAELKALQKKYP